MHVAGLIGKARHKSTLVLNRHRLDRNSREFIRHNKSVWRGNRQTSGDDGEVLFEINGMHSAIIAYSYLANVLARKHNARIVAFSDSRATGFAGLAEQVFEDINRKIYRSFNTDQFIRVTPDRGQKKQAQALLAQVYPALQTKFDLEKLSFDGVLIGDLVYDTYLRRESVPTIDLQDKRFLASLLASIEKFVFWRDYFDSHKVKALNISHCVYDLAIPLRIAISLDVPVYQINATHAYRLDRDNLLAYTDFKYYPEYFARLPREVRESGLREASARLERRFAGEVGVDMSYSTKSAFSEIGREPVLRQSDKIKILIATHCFFDSPHPYGINLFPDFYEWLSFLGEISDKTDYDWYVKTHPDFLPGNKAIIESFLQRFPRFTLIPADTSHRQIIHEGIDFALTVYGTVGFEYAALGVPVINASMCNPHVAYGFNFHPSSIDQYKELLLHLERLEINIDKQQVYEYYYMKNIYNTDDWMFDDFDQAIAELGGFRQQFTPEVYAQWLRQWSDAKHERIVATVKNFVESGDFRLDRRHV